ncbi:MAG: hypothetical protein LBE08_02240 [Bifidobacteriaceae bacterium]|jgi:hypothetical protein|nr:hypothetical protein [Bifidobacteriaceae bacterium]
MSHKPGSSGSSDGFVLVYVWRAPIVNQFLTYSDVSSSALAAARASLAARGLSEVGVKAVAIEEAAVTVELVVDCQVTWVDSADGAAVACRVCGQMVFGSGICAQCRVGRPVAVVA